MFLPDEEALCLVVVPPLGSAKFHINSCLIHAVSSWGTKESPCPSPIASRTYFLPDASSGYRSPSVRNEWGKKSYVSSMRKRAREDRSDLSRKHLGWTSSNREQVARVQKSLERDTRPSTPSVAPSDLVAARSRVASAQCATLHWFNWLVPSLPPATLFVVQWCHRGAVNHSSTVKHLLRTTSPGAPDFNACQISTH